MSDRDNAILEAAVYSPKDAEGSPLMEPEQVLLRWKGRGDILSYEASRSPGRSTGWGSSHKCDGHSTALTVHTRRADEYTHRLKQDRLPCGIFDSSEWEPWIIDVDELASSKGQLLERFEKRFAERKREIEINAELFSKISSTEADRRADIPGAEPWIQQYRGERQVWLPKVVREEFNDSLRTIGLNLTQTVLQLENINDDPSASTNSVEEAFADAIEDLAFTQEELDEAFKSKWEAALKGNTAAFFQLANYLMDKDDYKKARQLFQLIRWIDEEDRERAARIVYR